MLGRALWLLRQIWLGPGPEPGSSSNLVPGLPGPNSDVVVASSRRSLHAAVSSKAEAEHADQAFPSARHPWHGPAPVSH